MAKSDGHAKNYGGSNNKKGRSSSSSSSSSSSAEEDEYEQRQKIYDEIEATLQQEVIIPKKAEIGKKNVGRVSKKQRKAQIDAVMQNEKKKRDSSSSSSSKSNNRRRFTKHANASITIEESKEETSYNPFAGSTASVGPHARKVAETENWIPKMDTMRVRQPPGERGGSGTNRQHSGSSTSIYEPKYMTEKEIIKEDINYPQLLAKAIKHEKPLPAIYYFNPYQDYDYIVLQDMYMNSIAGRIIDLYVSFIFGNTGVKPVLRVNKKVNDEADAKLCDKYKYVITKIQGYEKFLETRGKNRLSYSMQTKYVSLVKRALIFGRSMFAYDFVSDMEYFEGRTHDASKLANSIKDIHPRDMGIIRQDADSWDLTGCGIRWHGGIRDIENLLYLEHEPASAVYRGGWYGLSFMQSMIGSSRTLRTLLDRVMPQFAKTNWASRAIVVFKKKGTAEDDPNEEIADIVPSLVTGEIGVFLEDDPHEDVAVHTLDVTPDMEKLVSAIEMHIKYIMAQARIPQALLYDEGNINLATLIGKMREFADQVQTKQKWAGEQIGYQFYQRHCFENMYGPESPERRDVYVTAEFDKVKVDSWQDTVKALRHLFAMFPIKSEAVGDLLGIDNFTDKVDPTRDPIDAGGNSNRLNEGGTAGNVNDQTI